MSGNETGAEDPWARLRRLTPARIALGHAGAAMPTAEVLRFGVAHAQARDAVHARLDVAALSDAIGALGHDVVAVESEAADRATYLVRPDLGRRLAPSASARLERSQCDLAIVVADGLSARAVHAQAVGLIAALSPWIAAAGWRISPIVVATQARVALGDAIAAALGSKAVLVLIGERPGLSSPDSLGAYLTLAPRPDTRDAERNCISNIRDAGLSFEMAAFKIAWHLDRAFATGRTGVELKDESDALIVEGRAPRPIPAISVSRSSRP